MADINLQLNLRPMQKTLYLEPARFQVRVLHRRAGKSFLAIAELVAEALTTREKMWRAFLLAPTFKQAKRINWDYLREFVKLVPGTQVNEAELRVDFPNGSRIQLLGAETYDSLRGQYAHKIVLDEAANIPSAAWTQVLRPMLADHEGTAVFMGTPQGRMNLLFDLYQYAETTDDPNWVAYRYTVDDTDVLSPTELKAMRREMSDADWQQEMMCSFTAAIKGAYYTKEMTAVNEQKRVTNVKYDAALPVHAALDLGWSDLMVAHFIQPNGTELQFIKTKAYQQTKIADMLHDWKDLPFKVDTIILPHDAAAHDLTSGMQRKEIFEQFCEDVQVAPRVKSKHEGIEQVRHLLPHCWFDKTECPTTVEALTQYRSDYDEVKRVAKLNPVHDWTSHYVDAVQTYALGRPTSLGSFANINQRAAASTRRRAWGV